MTFVACSNGPGPVALQVKVVLAGGPAPGGPRPYSDLRMHLIATNGKSKTVITDQEGEFRARVVPGAYRVMIGTPGNNADVAQPTPSTIMVTETGPNNFDLLVSVP